MNTVLVSESKGIPTLRIGAGVQESLTGNPGYFGIAEKHFSIANGSLHLFSGVGFRSNENHGHPVAGFKFSPTKNFTFGFQSDGHWDNAFVAKTDKEFTITLYLIDLEMFGIGLSWAKF